MPALCHFKLGGKLGGCENICLARVHLIRVTMRRYSLRLFIVPAFCMLAASCNKKVLRIEDAENPEVFTLTAPENVSEIELEVLGLLSGPARLLLFKPQNQQTPWKILDFFPIVAAGIPMGISPIRFQEKYEESQLILKYEPGGKTQGHFEIQYRFKSR